MILKNVIFLLLQLRGHQRCPSDNQEFRERTKKDAFNHLETELDRLQETAPGPLKETFGKEFKGFKHLFKRFLKEEGPSLDWDRIQKLPDTAVCILHSFIYLYINEIVYCMRRN